MPNYYEWYIPKRVIIGYSIGDIYEVDIVEASNIVQAMLAEEIEAPVHLIYDLTQQGNLHFSPAFAAKNSSYLKNPILGWGILYGRKQNKIQQFTSAIVAQTMGIRNRQFDTVEEALAFLTEIDNHLDFSQHPLPRYEAGKPYRSTEQAHPAP